VISRFHLSVFIVLCATLFSACGNQSGMVASDPATVNAFMRITPPADHPDAEAIVITDEGTMEIFGGGDVGFSVFERQRVVKVFNPRGHRYANIMIPYSTGSQVTDITARTITPSGRTVELKEADIFDVSLFPNFVFFSDQRAKIFTFPAVENGAVLTYSYKLRLSRGLWHGWHFQDEIPVLHSRFMLVKPGDWKITWRGYGPVSDPAITPAPAGFKSKHIWELQNIPPLKTEFGMPPAQEVLTRLAIAPIGFETWRDVSSWYHEILRTKTGGGPLVRALADSIAAARPAPRERLRGIFEWVRDHVRYIAVEIGVGGYTPHDAEDILGKRYGDCKDMVVLVCALAARADLRVLPVLTSTRQNGHVDTSLASPLQFNHLIAYAPDIDGGVWMDATEKDCRFGVLPWYDQGVDVVAAMEKSDTVLLRTPVSSGSANGMHHRWIATVDSTGKTSLRGSTILTGAVATETRRHLRSASRADRIEWIESFLAERVPVPDLDSLEVSGTSADDDTLSLSYTFHSPAFASRTPLAMVMRPGDILGSGLSAYFRSPTRTHPIRFRSGSASSLHLTITLPAGWRPGVGGGADSVRSEFGEWSTRWTADDRQVRIETRYDLKGEEIPAAQYSRFQRFIDAAQSISRQELVLFRPR
jgi:hypothetical protein